jgi:tripartite-type tricarboxylate transporter receptor subunit TctC
MMKKAFLHVVQVFVLIAFVLGAAGASLGEEFYRGKTLRFIVGYTPGGGYDTYTRAVARHISKYIPGNPTPVVQNMSGAGSLIAANYTYNKAKRDGLTLGIFTGAFVLGQALGDKRVKMDTRKLNWIGAPVKGGPFCGVMGFTGLKTLEDVLNSKKPIKMGGQRAGSTLEDLPKLLNFTLGTKFDVISGYAGTSLVRVAMQRREVDGSCWGWESVRVTGRALLDAKGDDKFIPFVIHNRWDDPEVKGLPLTPEVIKAKSGAEGLAAYNAWVGPYEFMRPISAPPGVPKERVEILRKAYKATFKDPQFLAEAKKSKLLLRHVGSKEIDQHVKRILSISPKTKEDLGFLVRKQK